MGMSLYPPGAIFCRACGYCLFGLPENRCPECGRGFDPGDPKTFLRRPRRLWLRRLLVWGGIPLLLLCLAYGGLMGWLYAGWLQEAGARALVLAVQSSGGSSDVQTEPILPANWHWLVPTACRPWMDRARQLWVQTPRLTAEQIRAIGACRRLRRLSLCDMPLAGEDIVEICRCRELTILCLSRNGLRGGDVGPLTQLVHLDTLGIVWDPEFGDAAMPTIGTLKNLRELHLGGTAISDAGIGHLAGLTRLCWLDLEGCRGLTDAALPKLYPLKNLSVLMIPNTHLTRIAVAKFESAMPGCSTPCYGGPLRDPSPDSSPVDEP